MTIIRRSLILHTHFKLAICSSQFQWVLPAKSHAERVTSLTSAGAPSSAGIRTGSTHCEMSMPSVDMLVLESPWPEW